MGVQTTFSYPGAIDFKPFLDKSTHYAVADEKYFYHPFKILISLVFTGFVAILSKASWWHILVYFGIFLPPFGIKSV